MKKPFIVLGLCMLALLVAAQDVLAQVPQSPLLPALRVPRLSQGAKVIQVVGLSEATIFYHRPGVKGREIWGGLLPYGEVWRAGANEPTLFTFSDEVTIEGKKLAPGTYRFVIIPMKDSWTVIFNSEVKNWGTVYDAKYDTLRFTVKPEAGPHEEWLSFSFADLTSSSARVVLAWEKMKIGFKIEFNTLGKLQASVGSWQVLAGAARYALMDKVYLNEAMTWIERSLALDRNQSNLRVKAELLAQTGKFQDAIATGEEAMKIGKTRDPKFESSQFAKDLGKLLEDWKTKK